MSDEMDPKEWMDFITQQMGEQMQSLDQTPAPVMREFSPDTRLCDLPHDMTREESERYLGTEFDKAIDQLIPLVDLIGGPNTAKGIAANMMELVEPYGIVNDGLPISEARVRMRVTDAVTLGLLAAYVLEHVQIGGAFNMKDILNGKGPFGG